MCRHLKDRGVMVAKYDGVCAFCKRPTSAGKSMTWVKVVRESNGEVKETRRAGHFHCYGEGASHLVGGVTR